MLLSSVSVLVIVQQSPEIPEGLMNNTVHSGYFDSAWSKIVFTSHNGKLPLPDTQADFRVSYRKQYNVQSHIYSCHSKKSP
jgi:hypothetical protein